MLGWTAETAARAAGVRAGACASAGAGIEAGKIGLERIGMEARRHCTRSGARKKMGAEPAIGAGQLLRQDTGFGYD